MLARIVNVQRHEIVALAWSFAYFFFLLAGYYVLRPLRDEMGVQSGAANLPYLFTAIFLTMLAVVPVFGWLSSRFPRRVLFMPLLAVLIVFGIVRRAGEFALSKPAREVLFTVVPREDKYKAKNVIDTLVYRGGDALSSTIATALRGLGLGLSGLCFMAVPLAAAWFAVAVWLGDKQKRLSAA